METKRVSFFPLIIMEDLAVVFSIFQNIQKTRQTDSVEMEMFIIWLIESSMMTEFQGITAMFVCVWILVFPQKLQILPQCCRISLIANVCLLPSKFTLPVIGIIVVHNNIIIGLYCSALIIFALVVVYLAFSGHSFPFFLSLFPMPYSG